MKYNGYIYLPPQGHRATARQLARLAGYQCISFDNQKPCKLKENAIVVNWGNSTWTRQLKPNPAFIFNRPENILTGIDKLAAFKKFNEHGIPCPEWTVDAEVAKEWFNTNHVVYTRSQLRGSSGEGITVQIPRSDGRTTFLDVASAKVHTKRFSGKQEFRIHVFGDEVIHIQQKKRKVTGRDNREDDNIFVKNLASNYIFAINDIECPANVQEAAIKAVACTGMDFGAVDIGFKVRNGEFCVFEINSRPALSGTTLIKYSEKLRSLAQ